MGKSKFSFKHNDMTLYDHTHTHMHMHATQMFMMPALFIKVKT